MSRPVIPRDLSRLPRFVRDLADVGVALFDADGTLWRDDVADDFTKWSLSAGHLHHGHLWDEYLRIYRDDHPAGCRYLLRLYAGLRHEALQQHIRTWWREHANRNWVVEAVEAMHHLAERGNEIWIVTGSPTDTMLPLCDMLPVQRVLGMDFAVHDGVITGELDGISCADEGKADKVRSMLATDQRVVFAAGNGTLDRWMIELSEGVRWSVYPNSDFLQFSRAQGWHILERPADFLEEAKLA
jgi:HAD superfamily phosphoserine phosphatase-like hydrolase